MGVSPMPQCIAGTAMLQRVRRSLLHQLERVPLVVVNLTRAPCVLPLRAVAGHADGGAVAGAWGERAQRGEVGVELDVREAALGVRGGKAGGEFLVVVVGVRGGEP